MQPESIWRQVSAVSNGAGQSNTLRAQADPTLSSITWSTAPSSAHVETSTVIY